MRSKILLFALILFASGSLAACSKDKCKDSEKAKLVDMTGLDGCTFMLELNSGDRLEVINWGDWEVHKEDGKKIWVSYKESEGASICMAGKMVEVTCITDR